MSAAAAKSKKQQPVVKMDGPTLSTDDVAERIGRSRLWVGELAARPPDHKHRLQAYIKNPNGPGWVPKTGPNPGKVKMMFYERDVQAYIDAHPPRTADLSDVEVDDETRKVILVEGRKLLEEDGFVNRAKLRDILVAQYGYSDSHPKKRIFRKIQLVAYEQQWPYPPMGHHGRYVQVKRSRKSEKEER